MTRTARCGYSCANAPALASSKTDAHRALDLRICKFPIIKKSRNRKLHRDAQAFAALGVVQRNGGAVRVGDALDDRQAEAAALDLGARDAVEPVEHALAL